MSGYTSLLTQSWIWSELKAVRNIRPSFNTPLGIWGGIAWSGLDTILLRGHAPWTWTHGGEIDAKHTKRAR